MSTMGRMAALHIAFWLYDPWYRRAWFVWPQVTTVLLASWLVMGLPQAAVPPAGNWAKPADCSNASTPGCASTRRAVFSWDDEVGRPTVANQTTMIVDRAAFRNSSAEDRPRLSEALGAYYRYDWAKALDILKPAAASDPNVQFLTALAVLIPNSTDQVRFAQSLLREAASGGHRQAGIVLGRLLVAGTGGLPKDEAAGRKLIDDGVAAGQPYAMRLAAAGYVSGEFGGTHDYVKAVDLLRKSADSGDFIAMAQYAYCINTGRGGLTRDNAKAIDYLRRAADAGFDGAQLTLARWFRDRYYYKEGEDEPEAIKWYERSWHQGQSLYSLQELAYLHRYARAAPFLDTKHSFELLQLCAPFRSAYCLYWLARAYHEGAGTPRDYTKAYAYYTVAKELGRQDASTELQRLDDYLQSSVKTSAAELAKTISAGLKPIPRVIRVQTAETVGPSPFGDAPPKQAASKPAGEAPASTKPDPVLPKPE
jgi:TPR repeat protein